MWTESIGAFRGNDSINCVNRPLNPQNAKKASRSRLPQTFSPNVSVAPNARDSKGHSNDQETRRRSHSQPFRPSCLTVAPVATCFPTQWWPRVTTLLRTLGKNSNQKSEKYRPPGRHPGAQTAWSCCPECCILWWWNRSTENTMSFSGVARRGYSGQSNFHTLRRTQAETVCQPRRCATCIRIREAHNELRPDHHGLSLESKVGGVLSVPG